MTFGSLFAGIGGIDLGLERAGMEPRWQVEIEPFAARVLAKHWPAVPRHADVREVGAHNLDPVDLIAGGFPCQDISVAGKGAGLTGERSGLWFEYLRIVQELRPTWVLAENVPALRTRGADTVLDGLAAAGYSCWPLVVGARHVGAPHRRDRVWIVGRLVNAARVDGGRGSAAECRGPLVGNSPRERGEWCREAWGWRAESPDTGAGFGMAYSCEPRLAGRRGQPVGGDAGDVAHAAGGGRDAQPLRGSGAPEGHRGAAADVAGSAGGGGAAELDDAASAGREADGQCGEHRSRSSVERGGALLAHGDGIGRDGQRICGIREGESLDGQEAQRGGYLDRRHGWPSRPDEPQHEWEEPRVVHAARDGERRESTAQRAERERVGATSWATRSEGALESPLGGATDGLSQRLAGRHRRNALKALGNSVVPQVVEAIGRAILGAA